MIKVHLGQAVIFFKALLVIKVLTELIVLLN